MVHRHRIITGWVVLAGYYALVVLLHEEVQQLLFILINRWSFHRYELRLLITWQVLALPVAVGVAVSALRRGRWGLLAIWMALVVCVAVIDRWFLFSQSERIHYPQYALLAAGLRSLVGNHWAALGLSSALGAGDEAYQAFVLYRHRGHPLDVRDVGLNVLGSAMGLVIFHTFAHPKTAPSTANEP